MVIPGSRGLSIKDFAKQFFNRFMDSDLPGIAAELSYYFLFSLFPFLVFLVALAAYLPLQPVVDEALLKMARVMPQEALAVIQDHLTGLVKNQRPRLMSIGVLISIWSASRGVSAFINGLNFVYAVRDRRSFVKVQAMAVGMTLASSLLVFIALALIALGGRVGLFIAERLYLGQYYNVMWSLLRWPLSALVIMVTMAANYYILPDVKQSLKSVIPGAVIGTLLWILLTWAFTLYAGYFGNYNATYGSIGGVMVLMTWLYLSGLIFLIGGELNAILQPAQDREEREPPPKKPGQEAVSS